MDPRLAALARAAPGAGELTGPAVGKGGAEHPVCGDRVEVFVRCDADMVTAFAWRANGCPATLAVAAAANAAILGSPHAQAPTRLRARLASLGDLAVHERHAERIFLTALDRAIGEALRADAGPA